MRCWPKLFKARGMTQIAKDAGIGRVNPCTKRFGVVPVLALILSVACWEHLV